MNKWTTSLVLLLLIMLVGCTASQNEVEQKQHSTSSDSFVEPEPSEWVEYIKPVRAYFYYRTQAVLHRDMQILWESYPRLREGEDAAAGINSEEQQLSLTRDGSALLDANSNVEGRSRIKIKAASEDKATVLVHGSIEYLWSNYEISGSELLIELDLERTAEGWTVVRSDAYTDPEYKAWINGE